MNETPEPAAKNRRWFVILAVVTLVGFAIFVGAITVLALRIPELKKSRYGLMEVGSSERPA
jgi:uncharacterized membrane protein YgdD (TMEM256/DUF423 family)